MFRYVKIFRGDGTYLQRRRCLFSSAANHFPNKLTCNRPKTVDFSLLFDSSTNVRQTKCIHALLLVSGDAQSIFMSTRLLNRYAFLGDVSLSHSTFNQIPNKDVYTWNSMVSALVRSGHLRQAMDCFHQFFVTSGLKPDFYTFPAVLKACRNLYHGRKIHCAALKLGLEWDVFVAASLIHMYTRFRFIHSARQLFDGMPLQDRGSWNAMISGYCHNGNALEALDLFDEMKLNGDRLDSVTLTSILPACAQTGDLLSGMLIHLYVIKHGLEFDLFISNALINMYAKFGRLGQAQKVFDQMVVRDLVSWNSIIASYAQNEEPITAYRLYKMMQGSQTLPDILTLVSLVSITSQLNDFQSGKAIHGFVTRRACLLDDVIIGNAIVDMYAKIGAVDSARVLFEGLPIKDVISWNTLITGYTQNGLASEAIELYHLMGEYNEIHPNQGTWVSILPAYSHIGALLQGMTVHARVIKICLDLDVFIGTCLVDLYGKCGRLDDSLFLFYQLPKKNPVHWNTVISCHAIHGSGEKALDLFQEMLYGGVKPDHITFTSLLAACSHSGLVNEGEWCFHVMQNEYGIIPSLKHYGCMVDLYGRAGLLDMANNFITQMPIRPDASIWGALLGACRIHGNIELGRYASDRLFEVDPENVGYYVLLSNMYANAGKWKDISKVRLLARERGLHKTPGWSSIEVNNNVNVFYTANQTHPKCKEIYNELSILTEKIKSIGYIPDYSFVLQDVEDDEKEHILTSHSERLAIVYGIISTPAKSILRIFKNLRVCGDCHNATKFLSKVTEREIIVRDSNRFHHFKDGICSCGDYW